MSLRSKSLAPKALHDLHPQPLIHPQTGSGRVDFLAGTVRAFPEWWGAVGDGTTDDAAAIQAAYRAVSVGQSAMLYFSSKTYAIGSELVFGITATIMSETGARLKAVGAATRGVRFTEGGATFKMVLPHLTGFSSYCLNLAGTDLAALQLQVRFLWVGKGGELAAEEIGWGT